MKKICFWVLAGVLSTSAWAKLPAPSDEAKAKAAEAKTTLDVMRSIKDLIDDTVENFIKLPAHTIVPHMRHTTDFRLDSNAINNTPSDEELESANDYIKSTQPAIHVEDFIQLGHLDAVAVMDRTETGRILFSTDLVWGLERLKDDNDAKFMTRVINWHEHGHAAWLKFRGKEDVDKITPEAFKGAGSRKSEAGVKVVH